MGTSSSWVCAHHFFKELLMSHVRLVGVALFSGLLFGCVPPNMVNGGLVNPWLTPYSAPYTAPVQVPVSYVDIYKYQGSRQCEGGGIPLAEMQRQLQSMGINVTNSSCGMDGRMYPAFCGGADGKINILTVPSTAVNSAMSQGFFLLSDLPGAQRSNCYGAGSPPDAGTTTYPYTGGSNTSYYSYQ
jgi:hypothetical protein